MYHRSLHLKKNDAVSGILLYTKQSGVTSFASLGAVKQALHTGKVGHTGTLDSFAEGLLVVLVGRLTRLVPYITAADKIYQAVVCFGTETDTLEISGTVTASAPVPDRERLDQILPRFRGPINQTPPAFSAVHVNGKRASDIARSGDTVELPVRTVTIRRLEMTAYEAPYGLFEIECSKGTYIRSLARDIAVAVGSCAHVVALRRTGVGAFRLENAVFSDYLEPFTLNSRGQIQSQSASVCSIDKNPDLIAGAVKPFLPGSAVECGLFPAVLLQEYAGSFYAGRPLRREWFICEYDNIPGKNTLIHDGDYAVFSAGIFAGVINLCKGQLRYRFVVPRER